MVEIVAWLRDSCGITFQRHETLFASDSENGNKIFCMLSTLNINSCNIYIYILQKIICRYIMYFAVFVII